MISGACAAAAATQRGACSARRASPRHQPRHACRAAAASASRAVASRQPRVAAAPASRQIAAAAWPMPAIAAKPAPGTGRSDQKAIRLAAPALTCASASTAPHHASSAASLSAAAATSRQADRKLPRNVSRAPISRCSRAAALSLSSAGASRAGACVAAIDTLKDRRRSRRATRRASPHRR
jgi:hypothetical protein